MNTSKLARYFLILLSTLLVFFGFETFVRLAEHPEYVMWYAFYALAMLLEAAVLLFCYLRLKTPNKNAFLLTTILLGANVVLIIFDQIGFIDILFAFINLTALVMFLMSRKDFLPA